MKRAYDQQLSLGFVAFETNGGALPCKKIFFRPWVCDKNSQENPKQVTGTFVSSVITYALAQNFTTIGE